MTLDIDHLLAAFSKELDYFVFTRDHLQPVMTQLVRAVERSLSNASDVTAHGETVHLRLDYAERFAGIQPLLEEWVRIQGSSDALWLVEATMAPPQMARFQALLSRDATIAGSRETFDSLQDHLRRQLLRFEEMTG